MTRPARNCQIPGCEEVATKWYVHTGSGLRYLCEPHFAALQAAAKLRGMEIANGNICDPVPLEAIQMARKRVK